MRGRETAAFQQDRTGERERERERERIACVHDMHAWVYSCRIVPLSIYLMKMNIATIAAG